MSRLIISVVVILIAAASIIVLIFSSASSRNYEAAMNAALPLVEANFDAVTYFEIAQLPPKSEAEFDYANYPEGSVPCDTSVFADYNALSQFVSNTYVPSEAARILASSVNGSPRYFNQNGELCKTIAPTNTSYTKDFSKYNITVKKATADSAVISVTVQLKAGGTEELTFTMVKDADRWLLEKMVY